MQRHATSSDTPVAVIRDKSANAKRSHQRSNYQKVVDARKRPIRGLRIRGSRYHARIAVEDFNTGRKEVRRVPLGGKRLAGLIEDIVQLLSDQKEGRTKRPGPYQTEWATLEPKMLLPRTAS